MTRGWVRRVVLVAALVCALAGAASLALAVIARPNPAPSAGTCAAQWNLRVNRSSQERAAKSGLPHAIVFGWMAKETYPGCSVVVLDRVGGPWLMFGRQSTSPRSDWSLATGRRWGVDNPTGAIPGLNTQVNADGTVSMTPKGLTPRWGRRSGGTEAPAVSCRSEGPSRGPRAIRCGAQRRTSRRLSQFPSSRRGLHGCEPRGRAGLVDAAPLREAPTGSCQPDEARRTRALEASIRS